MVGAESASAPVTPFASEPAGGPAVSGFLHLPAAPSGDGLVLTHGAGSNCRAPLLEAVAAAFAGSGLTVLRCDLPYRQRRPQGAPGPGDAERDRAGLKSAMEAVRRLVSGRVFLGGHSYGGRQASMAAASEPSLADALLLLSYPLHPPGREAQMRTAHFPQLRAPALFAHGARDPFGSLEQMRDALALIPAPVRLHPIDNAGHDLLPARRKSASPEVAAGIAAAFLSFLSLSAEPSSSV